MGRVAFGCASRLAELGHRIVGMADSQVFVYCAQGLDTEALYRMKRESRVLDRDGLPEGWETYPTEACVAAECDVLIPAALANTVNGDNAASVKAGLVVEAANIAVSPEADEILKERGVRLICDFTANLSEAWLYDAVFFGAVTPGALQRAGGRGGAVQEKCGQADAVRSGRWNLRQGERQGAVRAGCAGFTGNIEGKQNADDREIIHKRTEL